MRGSRYFAETPIPELYTWFAGEAAASPVWEQVCLWVARTPELGVRLDALPGAKRQPNLFLGALRYLDAPLRPGPELLAWVEQHWDRIERVILTRATQTNEPGRCATLLPVLAMIAAEEGRPLALVEVGCSAGLCLIPDRYRYRWETHSGAHTLGDSPLELECQVAGPAPLPERMPEIAWRAGIDVNPLDPRAAEDARWLRSLVWPGQEFREQRLATALDLAAETPIRRVRGDAVTALPEVVAAAPPEATVVVFHSAVLAYLDREHRLAFAQTIDELVVRWISNEGDLVVRRVRERLTDIGSEGFVLALDGRPLARGGPHGQFLRWYA